MTERKKRILFCSEATFLNTGYSTYTKEIMKYLHSTGKYELAEMASYGQRNDPRGAALPWKYYGVEPNSNFEPKATEAEMKSYHSSPTNTFGAFMFENVCLDFRPDIVFDIRDFWMMEHQDRSPFRRLFNWCFPAGTSVITEFGYDKPIERFLVRDEECRIVTHKGNQKSVTHAQAFEYEGLMTKIKAEGMAEDIVCTEDHEILVLKRQNRIWDRKNKRYHKISDSLDINSKEFIPSSDIRNGDYLMLPIMQFGKGLEIDDETLWIIGHFLADGSAREDYRISFAFHSDEIDTIKRIESYFKDETGDKKISGNSTTLRYNGKHLVEKFSKYYYFCEETNSYLKSLPLEYKNLNSRQGKILLDGYFAGDGCVTRTNHNTPSIEIFSKSKVLARQISEIGRALGYCFRLSSRKSQPGYTIRLSGSKCKGFSKELTSSINHSTIQAKKDFNRVIIKDGYFLMPVTNVKTYEDSLTVYDIEVSEDHSFLTHCAVHNCIMPTVDAEPQARQWISTYANADAVFSYSEWSGELMKRQSDGKIKYQATAPPSANPAYKPMDKNECRKTLGLDPDIKIIGTVMRNQRRKLFPDLFEAFSEFLKSVDNPQEYKLYCHTAYPDLGWDIPELLQEYGLASSVYFTYQCADTKQIFASLFAGAYCESPFTGKCNSGMCNVREGASYEQLATVMNTFDLYVQYANSEGFGLPQVEAAACGIPVMATDYSAMSSVVRNLGGYPIPLKAKYKELETGCYRAVPDNMEAATIMFDFFVNTTEEEKQDLSKHMVKNFKKYYQWDISGKRLEECFDALPNKNLWNTKPIINKPKPKPENLPNKAKATDIARWLIIDVLGEPDKINTYFESRLIRDLMYGSRTSSTGGLYINESSAGFEGRVRRQPFNFNLAYEEMVKIADKRNYWEGKRIEASNV